MALKKVGRALSVVLGKIFSSRALFSLLYPVGTRAVSLNYYLFGMDNGDCPFVQGWGLLHYKLLITTDT